MNINTLRDKIKNTEQKQIEYKGKSNLLSTFRFISFLIFLLIFIFGIIESNNIYILVSFIIFFIFIYLVIIHENISSKERYLKFYLQTLNEYIARFKDGWKEFSDGGSEFLNDDNVYLADLDVLGDNSLYKFLNVCKTKGGRSKLYKRLSNQYIEKDELIKNQQAIKEMAENIEFSLDFQTTMKEFAGVAYNQNLRYAINAFKDKITFNIFHLYMGIFISLATITLLIIAALGLTSWIFFFDLFFIQLGYSYIISTKYKKTFKNITDSSTSLSSLEGVFNSISKANFNDKTLNKYKNDIIYYGQNSIKEINRIKDIDTIKLNYITYLIFNGFMPLNIIVIYLFYKFQQKYSDNIHLSINAVEEFEVLASLAILGQVKENVCLPTFEDKVSISFSNLKHPLLKESECIANSFITNAGVNIITGSNMSGKTSFLRTIGINLILMNAGGFVNSLNFKASYLKIFTSMRISDDLSKGISTFYGELLRIKKAIEYQKINKPMIAFIDEVFKGTNSNDRIQGAISMVEKLNNDNCILFITTHDFELCDIEGSNIKNYHFSEYYIDDKIMFDYKIKEGKCKTTNAKYLMKLAGITD